MSILDLRWLMLGGALLLVGWAWWSMWRQRRTRTRTLITRLLQRTAPATSPPPNHTPPLGF
ncbi:MAG TPA: hypothetical protein PK299_05905 [Anaerolineales bacterium]|nr:hypothetical protein [Anaerolineales bacterium]